MRNVIVPDLPDKRPVTRREARELIMSVYAENRWDASEQAWHAKELGLEEKLLSDRTNEEFHTIIAAFDRAKMVIFAN